MRTDFRIPVSGQGHRNAINVLARNKNARSGMKRRGMRTGCPQMEQIMELELLYHKNARPEWMNHSKEWHYRSPWDVAAEYYHSRKGVMDRKTKNVHVNSFPMRVTMSNNGASMISVTLTVPATYMVDAIHFNEFIGEVQSMYGKVVGSPSATSVVRTKGGKVLTLAMAKDWARQHPTVPMEAIMEAEALPLEGTNEKTAPVATNKGSTEIPTGKSKGKERAPADPYKYTKRDIIAELGELANLDDNQMALVFMEGDKTVVLVPTQSVKNAQRIGASVVSGKCARTGKAMTVSCHHCKKHSKHGGNMVWLREAYSPPENPDAFGCHRTRMRSMSASMTGSGSWHLSHDESESDSESDSESESEYGFDRDWMRYGTLSREKAMESGILSTVEDDQTALVLLSACEGRSAVDSHGVQIVVGPKTSEAALRSAQSFTGIDKSSGRKVTVGSDFLHPDNILMTTSVHSPSSPAGSVGTATWLRNAAAPPIAQCGCPACKQRNKEKHKHKHKSKSKSGYANRHHHMY